MKKQSTKDLLKLAEETLDKIFYNVYHVLGKGKALQLILNLYNENLLDIDYDIEMEKEFVKENPPGSAYSSAGQEAKSTVKRLQKNRAEWVKLIKSLETVIKQLKKVEKF